jgi:hypothetical protein
MRNNKWLRWSKGRQGDNYEKLMLWEIPLFKFGTDCYIIKYEPNCTLKPHIDKVKGKHLRVNIILSGHGKFYCNNPILNLKRIKIFRADKYMHSMKNGPKKRIVLSLGFKY